MVDPGWYPDPLGLWDGRWWDGGAWNDAVRTGRHQDSEPIVDLSELLAVQPVGGLVWQGERGDPTHPGHYILTDSAMSFYRSVSDPPVETFPLWSIALAEARIKGGQGLRGVGDVALTIAYPGYSGKATFVLRSVPDPERIAALICRHARLARMRANHA